MEDYPAESMAAAQSLGRVQMLERIDELSDLARRVRITQFDKENHPIYRVVLMSPLRMMGQDWSKRGQYKIITWVPMQSELLDGHSSRDLLMTLRKHNIPETLIFEVPMDLRAIIKLNPEKFPDVDLSWISAESSLLLIS